MTVQRIGLIGVGLMGSGIASSILRAGYPLGFFIRPGTVANASVMDAGGVRAETVAALVAESDTLILCVTGAEDVEDVMAQALEALRPGMMVIDCSTSLPQTSRALAASLAERGVRFIDAAMSRTPKEAAEGRLALIVGADQPDFDAALPLLNTFAEAITHVGPVGAGHTAKLLHNYVSLGFAAVMAEAAACAHRAGLDKSAFMDVLESGGGRGAILERMRPYIETDDGSGFQFSLVNAQKDFGYYCGMADAAGAGHVIADAIRSTYDAATDTNPDGTIPELLDHLKS